MAGDKQVYTLRIMGPRMGFTDIERTLSFLIEIGGRRMKIYFSVIFVDVFGNIEIHIFLNSIC